MSVTEHLDLFVFLFRVRRPRTPGAHCVMKLVRNGCAIACSLPECLHHEAV